MKHIKIIALINLLLILVYSTTTTLILSSDTLDVLVVLMLLVVTHGILNILVAIVFFIMRKNSYGKAFLLGAAIALVIGYSSCWGSGELIGAF